ncbi:MAG: hypothetical protein HN472_12610 [Nitrospina sp.]|jgi:hypothetical protein|nr:hypothetical protein [Nitrospina sp.]MBT3875867.1 hypothetical protein [Nitrospina sp.]MBT4049314.1 hypothetical protein [Nitrospina sp.]MBT4557282.1 hypothetical protein [Nitrospina sp.]MBT5347554.1 hypothetical protein [Nitrospina sp.]
MPTTPLVNTQQVLQMGSHTEKLQHTMQTLPNVVALQADKERELEDELKRRQVQDMDPTHYLEETDPHTKPKKRLRNRKKSVPATEADSPEPPLPEDPYRGKLNILA